MGKRNERADVAKGIATVLVVAGHLIKTDLENLPHPYFFSIILNLAHMPLFVLLSGFFAVRMLESSFSSVLKKTVFRLVIPYIVWSSVAVIAKGVFGMPENVMTLRMFGTLWLETLLYGTSIWFFFTLSIIWILSWFLYQVEKRFRCFPAILVIILFVLILPIPNTKSLYVLYRTQELLPVFYLGFFTRRKISEHDIFTFFQGKGILFAVAFSCIFLLVSPFLITDAFTSALQQTLPLKVLVDLLMLASVFIPSCFIIGKLKYCKRLFATLGPYSMHVYCIHMVFVEYLRFQTPAAVWNWPQVYSAIFYFLNGLIIAVISMGIAYVLSKYIGPYRWIMTGNWSIFNTNSRQSLSEIKQEKKSHNK